MRYRLLGRTGLKVSQIGLGCMMFGWRADQQQVDHMVGVALDAGINLFDTSVSYGRGASECALGHALKAFKRRDDVLLATKVGLPSEPEPGPNGVGLSRNNIIRQCELSLRRLGVDHIDLLQIHRPSPDVPIDETLRALDQLVRDGKVRYVGTSNFAAWRIVEALWLGDRLGLRPPASEQLCYNLLNRSAEVDVLPVADRYGIGILAYSPLAEGLLTGKYRAGEALPADSRFAQSTRGVPADRMTAPVITALSQVEAQARMLHVSMANLAMAWVMNEPRIACVLAGPSRADQLLALVQASDIELSGEVLAALDTIVAPGDMVS